MDSTLQIINECSSDLLAGSLIGLISETVFPNVEAVSSANVLRVSLELLGQVALNGFLVYQYFQFQASRGMANPRTNYIIIAGFSLFAVQPSLMGKYYGLASFLKSQMSGSAAATKSGTMSEATGNLTFEGPSTNQNNTPGLGNNVPSNSNTFNMQIGDMSPGFDS
jgi:hypothetical protein